MKNLLRNNGLSLVLVTLFLGFWAGQAWTGFKVHNEEEASHGRPPLEFAEYLHSGHFWQATGENWESEFLQMGAYVVLTTYLFQRGSAESNDPDQAEQLAAKRKRTTASWLYRNSLSLGLMALFAMAFTIHASGGLVEFNEELVEHGKPPESLGQFLGEPEFWFQSFQNWQSEFLAVLAIVVLSIFLRQNGSPESKDVSDPHSKTGA